VLESTGKFFHQIAESFDGVETEKMLRTGRKCHQLSVTAITVACTAGVDGEDGGEFVYSTSKDSSIVKWDLKSGEKLAYIPGGIKPTKRIKGRLQHESMLNHVGHSCEILTCAASTDGKFLVSENELFCIYLYLPPDEWVIADDYPSLGRSPGPAFSSSALCSDGERACVVSCPTSNPSIHFESSFIQPIKLLELREATSRRNLISSLLLSPSFEL
jgi:hypothetical protein